MVRNYIRKRPDPSWTKGALKEAVEEVRSGKMSGYQAALKYKIPRSTIMSHVNGTRGQKKESVGRPRAIPETVEQEIAASLHIMERNGFGLSRGEVLELIQDFVNENKIITPFKDGKPGQEWFSDFCHRYNLSLKKPQSVELSRKKAADPFIFDQYFNLIRTTIQNLDLQNKPHRIWNIDETSFVSDPKKTKIVGLKGYAATRTTATAGKDNTTVLFSANAAGGKGPPFIIYKGKNTWSEWISPDAYPGTVYTATENGWIETKAFREFITKSFIPMLGGTDEPTLLIYDGHSTHVQLSVIQIAKQHNITIIKLPAHSSHLLQPLDLSVFKPLKDKWDSVMVEWQRSNYGQKLTKKEFSLLIGRVWKNLDSLNIINGFKKGGIFPVNPNVISKDKFDPLALQRWEAMKADSTALANDKTLLQTPTSHSKKNKLPLTLASLSLEHVKRCLGMANLTRNLEGEKNTYPELVKNINEPKIAKCPDSKISFEELLLRSLKKRESLVTTKSKTRIAGSAEIITHTDVIDKLKKQEEEKQNKISKRKLKESRLIEKNTTIPTNNNNIKKLKTERIIAIENSQTSPVASTSKCPDVKTSNNIKITDIKCITNGQNILKKSVDVKKKIQIENVDPKKIKITKKASKNTINIKNIKQEKGLKKRNYASDSSNQSDYSICDSDMSDFNISEDILNLDDINEDLLAEPSQEYVADIKKIMKTQRKYSLFDWVLVKFTTKKSAKYFIGQIVKLINNIPTVKYVRKIGTSKQQSKFSYPIIDDICELKHTEDVLSVLPAPEISRRGHIVFSVNFNDYNIQ